MASNPVMPLIFSSESTNETVISVHFEMSAESLNRREDTQVYCHLRRMLCIVRHFAVWFAFAPSVLYLTPLLSREDFHLSYLQLMRAIQFSRRCGDRTLERKQ